MKNIFKKVVAFLLCCAILLSFTSCFRKNPNNNNNNNPPNDKGNSDVGDYLIEGSEVPLRIHYYEETPFINDNSSAAFGETGKNVSWENWSLPIGNGYFGVNVFGRTETERVQIADKTLENAWQANIPEENWPQTGGLNNFAETYLDIGHVNSDVSDYYRYLDLNTATSGVSYVYDDVEYTREYFTSYPDKALVIRLDASEDGQIDFVLRPVVPYEQEYMTNPKDGFGKYGEVVSSVSDGVGRIELTGKMTYYDVDFVGYYEVYTDGGTVSATTCKNSYGETDGTITVSGANSAYIVVTLGSDYELNSLTFLSGQHEQNKPTKNTTLDDAKRKVNGYLDAIHSGIQGKSYQDAYEYLLDRHLKDYQEIFGRVAVDLDFEESDLDLSTDMLLEKYKRGEGSTYLEALLLQYGRYLLISSSREGTLPAHLQGAWNVYNSPAWSSGYWNNINVQMNYWHAFSTNIGECFESYIDFMNTYMVAAKSNASNVILTHNPGVYGQDGGNGWTLGTCSNAYFIQTDRNCGNLGFITQLYWDYYQFTKDPEVLEMVYNVMLDAARFITKCVKEYDGKYLVEYSDSPEMHVDGIWYYTVGTTYAQTFAYMNNYSVLQLAKELGIDITNSSVLEESDKTILKTILNQLDKYDPINVGLSGQIKEFREEDYYGSVGHETLHRHISQLVGLYPGNLINADTDAWMDAALVSLNGRVEGMQDWHQAYTVGWSWAHKAALYARLGMGDEAQEMLLGLSRGATLENLLMICFSIFQIEASCGTSAALTEMLLQSQNGYVEPLPAIPSNWSNGSYTGLVARGNFEVSAAWENGLATSFNILSNKGERLTIKYPSITNAKVYTADGKAVDFDVVGQDLIAFDTTAGEKYVIYGLEKVDTIDKVASLDYEVVAYGDYVLTWEAVDNATSYNVYVAYDNDAKYTLINNVKNNGVAFSAPVGKENARKTFAVAAVNADGRESARTCAYYNPVDTTPVIDGFSMNVSSDSQLEVTVQASDSVVNYVLWEQLQGSAEFTKVAESAEPTLVYNNYKETSEYAITAVSVDGSVSEKFIFTQRYDEFEILEGKEFIPTTQALNAIYSNAYNFTKLTDGINYEESTGRYSSKVGTLGMMDATVDLGGSFILSKIKIYDYQQDISFMGTALEIYTVFNGQWTKVVSVTNSQMQNYRKTDNGAAGTGWLEFDLGGVKADMIRIHIPACTSSSKSISIYEIQCYGARNPDYDIKVLDNIFDGKQFVPTPNAANMQFNAGLGYHCLTDGIHYREGEGRFSTKYNGFVDATIDLGAVYKLKDIRFYMFQKNLAESGSSIQIQVCYNGIWNTVKNISQADYPGYVKSDAYGQYLDISLDHVFADKVRVYIPGHGGSGYVTFYEIECSAAFIKESTVTENVFANKEFVPTEEAKSYVLTGSNYQLGGYEALTDGIITEDQIGRLATIMSKDVIMEATLDLGGAYELYDLIFYIYDGWEGPQVALAGKDLLVRVYYNGQWIDVVNCENNAAIAEHHVHPSDEWRDDYLHFNLNGVKAEKVSFYISGSDSPNGLTFHEIVCSGSKIN